MDEKKKKNETCSPLKNITFYSMLKLESRNAVQAFWKIRYAL